MDEGGSVQEQASASFIEEFRLKYGRAPRILHIGNIANNAYLNAKFLNEAGFDCDVICYDYYHIMGCPEWEEADFDARGLDHFKPDWTAVDLGGYKRPHWFAQGPQKLCIDYLIAKRTGDLRLADVLWKQLSSANGTASISDIGFGAYFYQKCFLQKERAKHIADILLRHPDALTAVWSKLGTLARKKGTLGFLGMAWFVAPAVISAVIVMRLIGGLILWVGAKLGGGDRVKVLEFNRVVAARVEQFARAFPERADRLSADDCSPYAAIIHQWRRLFNQYDVVQAYATDVVYPMLTDYHAYVGFEHGTLRDFTLGGDSISRLTALGYHKASHVLITNGDCLEYAQKIHVKSFTPMVHPIDDGLVARVHSDYERLHAEYGVKYLFICPLRHDWKVKGADRYIRSLPKLVDKLGRNFRLIMTTWGSQVNDSVQLANSLGVADLIVWTDPLNRIQLVRYHKSVDVVFDQIALPHFGATSPQAIAAGVPVIMSYDPASTEWIIPEPAPILSAWTEDEIVSAVIKAVDPVWLSAYKEQARYWFNKYHSSSVVVEKLAHTYRCVLKTNNLI